MLSLKISDWISNDMQKNDICKSIRIICLQSKCPSRLRSCVMQNEQSALHRLSSHQRGSLSEIQSSLGSDSEDSGLHNRPLSVLHILFKSRSAHRIKLGRSTSNDRIILQFCAYAKYCRHCHLRVLQLQIQTPQCKTVTTDCLI